MNTLHRRPRPRVTSLIAGVVVPLVLVAGAGVQARTTPTSPSPSRSQAHLLQTRVHPVAATTRSPLAGRHWGVYKGSAEQAWDPYVRATGARKRLLGKIALRPKAKWFGSWITPAEIGQKVRDYIASSTAEHPDALVQMTVFRMVPWEAEVDDRLPSRAEQACYKAWIDHFAAAVGDDTHAAIILQPDGPLALKAPQHSRLPSQMIAYAARKFGALDRTSTYIDAGASDWPAGQPELAATIVQRAGVKYVRGFALNATHYTSTAANIEYGTKVVAELASRGLPGKHFVVDTAENGRPFEFSQFRGTHPNNAKVCETRAERRCVTLGIPPTANVASRAWGLSPANRARARAHVDGYLWFGRPWLHMQTNPFDMHRALAMARTTPY